MPPSHEKEEKEEKEKEKDKSEEERAKDSLTSEIKDLIKDPPPVEHNPPIIHQRKKSLLNVWTSNKISPHASQLQIFGLGKK